MDSRLLHYTVYYHLFPNGKYYIGITSRTLEARFNGGNGYRTCPRMYQAIQEYGWKNVEHGIIASSITEAEAQNFEKILINKLQSNDIKFGYNTTTGGSGHTTIDYCEVNELWNQGLSVQEISSHMGRNRGSIAEFLRKTGASEFEIRSRGHIRGKEQENNRKIYCMFKNENKPVWEISEILNLTKSYVRSVLRKSGVSPQETTIVYNENKPPQYNIKAVSQFSLQNEYIQTFVSLAEANRSLGKRSGDRNISLVCYGARKTAYGYVWKFANGVDDE